MMQTLDTMGRQYDREVEGQTKWGKIPAAPALGLQEFCFTGRVCKFFEEDADFRRLAFGSQQTAFVKGIAESRYDSPVFINALDSTERRIRHTSHEMENHGVLCSSIPDSAYSDWEDRKTTKAVVPGDG
jgi:hypothetical protein